jgi:sec-independent protein translocase protein TatA
MGSMSPLHWLIVLAVVLLLFGGRGKISSLMGDFGKGLSAFKKGVSSDNSEQNTAQGEPGDTAKPITAQTSTASPSQAHQDHTAKV